MEQVALRVSGETWTYLGGDSDAKQPLEVVIRAFDHDAQACVGDEPTGPGDAPVTVPRGEGRRLTGRHFFVRPNNTDTCVVSYRGIETRDEA